MAAPPQPAAQSSGSRDEPLVSQTDRHASKGPPPQPETHRVGFTEPSLLSGWRRSSGNPAFACSTTPSAVPQMEPQALMPITATYLNPSGIIKQEKEISAVLGSTNSPLAVKPRDRKAGEAGGVLGWVTGKSSKQSARGPALGRIREWAADLPADFISQPGDDVDSRPSSSEEKRKCLAFLKQDPLNVHQLILKHLQGSARKPITTVSELAILITDSCVGLFDQYQIPDEFQFFDFFERSIGAVVSFKLSSFIFRKDSLTLYKIDGETKCLQAFAKSLDKTQPGDDIVATDALYSITAETKLLVEIKDIRDELDILQMVLTDQSKPSRDFAGIIENRKRAQMDTAKEVDSPKAHNTVLESHLYRIEKMEKLAKKTYQAVGSPYSILHHLLMWVS